MSGELHISSFVLRVRPQATGAVAATLAGLEGLEIHAVAEGKIVVTLESASEQHIVRTLDHMQGLEGVLAANLVFHHAEPAASLEGSSP